VFKIQKNSFYIEKEEFKSYLENFVLELEKKGIKRDIIKSSIHIEKTNFKTLENKEVIKVVVDDETILDSLMDYITNNNPLSILGDFIKEKGLFVFEKNISFKRRYWFIDIEVLTVDLKERDNTPLNPLQPIISIQLFDSETQKYIILLNNEIQKIDINLISKSTKKLGDKFYSFEKNGNEIIISIDENEFEMLKTFLKIFKKYKPSIILGWFSNMYDIPYIVRRMELYDLFKEWKINNEMLNKEINNTPHFKIFSDSGKELKYFLNVPMVSFIDYKELYEKFMSTTPESWSLDYVSKLVLGSDGGKKELGFMQFDKNIEQFFDYIYRDVELLYLMEQKLQLIELLVSFNDIVPIPIHELMKSISTVEGYLNRYAFERNILLPYKKKGGSDISEDTFEGAFVFQPENKIYDNVVVFDFASLYPNLIRTFNISFETLLTLTKDKVLTPDILQNHLEVNFKSISKNSKNKPMYIDMNTILDEKTRHKKQVFFLQKPSLIKGMIDNILELRFHYKQQYKQTNSISDYNKQLNYKILANSIYGVFGTKYFTFYNPLISASITGSGRYIIGKLIEKIDGLKLSINNYDITLKPVYGDTDSIFISYNTNQTLDENTILQISEHIREQLNRIVYEIIEHAFVNWDKEEIEKQITLKLEIDKIFKKVKFFGVKKRYYGLDFNNNPIYKGVDLARSDASNFMKKWLKQLFDYFLLEIGDNIQMKKDEIKQKFWEIYNDLKNSSLLDIGESKTFTSLNYKVLPYHVRGLKLYRTIFGIDETIYLNQKIVVIPIIIKDNYEYFNEVKEIFNEKRKQIKEISGYLSFPYDEKISLEIENYINNTNGISIDYYHILSALLKRISFGVDDIIQEFLLEIQGEENKNLIFNLFNLVGGVNG